MNVHILNFLHNDRQYTDVSIRQTNIFLSNKSGDEDSILKRFNIANLTIKDIKDKSFYRYPKLSLPRMKIDLLKQKANIKITRNKKDADYYIVSKNFIKSLTSHSYKQTYTGEVFLEGLESYSQYFNKNTYTKLKKILEDNIDDLFVVSQGYLYNRSFDINYALDKKNSYSYTYIDAENISVAKELFNTSNLVLDTNIINLIYEDMHTLTKEEYANARNMIKSEDRENRALALELLSNCNLTKSFDYVSLLFYFYYDYLKDAKNWNSVNVKTLRESLSDFRPYNSDTRFANYYNNYLKKLIEHNQLTEFAFKQVVNYLFHNVLKKGMRIEDDSVFSINIDAIKINPAYIDKLKDNESFFAEVTDPIELTF